MTHRPQILEALADDTRGALYDQIRRAREPLSAGELAQSIGLHPNTVRPHLTILCEAGLIDISRRSGGRVGRPQHHYVLADTAPATGMEVPVMAGLANLLAGLATEAGADGNSANQYGVRYGRADAQLAAPASTCVDTMVARMDNLGFEPSEQARPDSALAENSAPPTRTVEFLSCPFAGLAQTHPDLVCGLHRGMVEGFIEGSAECCKVTDFRTIAQDPACRVEVSTTCA